MQPAKLAYVKSAKPRNTALRRGIVFTVLTIFCVVCFWYAFSGVNPPPCPLSSNPANGDNTACGVGSGGRARPTGLGAILSGQATDKTTLTTGNSHLPTGPVQVSGARSGGGGFHPAGGSSITSVSASNTAISGAGSSATAGDSSNPLMCRSQCQTSSSTCQMTCSRQFSATNQTQSWMTCMQTCSSKMSTCANSCLSGVKPPPNVQVPLANSATQANGGAQSGTQTRSKPTPSLPIQMPDSSSSSSSSN
jgi:hypothetical protein